MESDRSDSLAIFEVMDRELAFVPQNSFVTEKGAWGKRLLHPRASLEPVVLAS